MTSPELKHADDQVIVVVPEYADDGITPTAESLLAAFDYVEKLVGSGAARTVSTPGYGCMAEAMFKMCVGNFIGLRVRPEFTREALLNPAYGSFVIELAQGASLPEAPKGVTVAAFGQTLAEYALYACGERMSILDDLQKPWENALSGVYPYLGKAEGPACAPLSFDAEKAGVTLTRHTTGPSFAKPRVVIPVFPGTNCEYDSARAFERVGAVTKTVIVNNLTPQAVSESVDAMVRAIRESQIVFIPGGFSGGDEPDGSAKFIVAFFRNPAVTEAVRDLLQARDGLMLGVCNGFQALIKLGLVPYGDIVDAREDSPTLTFNPIGRHQSRLVRTRVASTISPWLSKCKVGDVHNIAISHGEGRFVCTADELERLEAAGQIATQYVNADRLPSMNLRSNPNGSFMAVEGITSPDGRVLGKMGHTERSGEGLYKNVPGNAYQPLFEGGVSYFA